MAELERHGTLTRSRLAGDTTAAEKNRHARNGDGREMDSFGAASHRRGSLLSMWRGWRSVDGGLKVQSRAEQIRGNES